MSVVGQNVPRVDGPAKVRGTAGYMDDISSPGEPTCTSSSSSAP